MSAAARELPRVALDDALLICLVLRDGDPDRYQRAPVRWLGRFALEAGDVTIGDLRLAPRRSTRCATEPASQWSGCSAYALPMESGELAACELLRNDFEQLARRRRSLRAV